MLPVEQKNYQRHVDNPRSAEEKLLNWIFYLLVLVVFVAGPISEAVADVAGEPEDIFNRTPTHARCPSEFQVVQRNQEVAFVYVDSTGFHRLVVTLTSDPLIYLFDPDPEAMKPYMADATLTVQISDQLKLLTQKIDRLMTTQVGQNLSADFPIGDVLHSPDGHVYQLFFTAVPANLDYYQFRKRHPKEVELCGKLEVRELS